MLGLMEDIDFKYKSGTVKYHGPLRLPNYPKSRQAAKLDSELLRTLGVDIKYKAALASSILTHARGVTMIIPELISTQQWLNSGPESATLAQNWAAAAPSRVLRAVVL